MGVASTASLAILAGQTLSENVYTQTITVFCTVGTTVNGTAAGVVIEGIAA